MNSHEKESGLKKYKFVIWQDIKYSQEKMRRQWNSPKRNTNSCKQLLLKIATTSHNKLIYGYRCDRIDLSLR